jgi:hypothetical protein
MILKKLRLLLTQILVVCLREAAQCPAENPSAQQALPV